MKRLRSPISWLGGKSRMVPKLLPLFPPHRIYVEPFGGGASLLLAKEPSAVEVYNDLDSGLVSFFRVLRDPKQVGGLIYRCSATPYSREEYSHCLATWESCDDPVERAYRWFVASRMSFGGIFGSSWGSVVASSSHSMAETSASWISAVIRLEHAHLRLMRVQVENQDFRRVLRRYDTPETLFYVDPPYVPATRRSGSYRHEMTLADHKELVGLLLGLKGMALLSGYDHAVYRPLEKAGWQKRRWSTTCNVAARTRRSRLAGPGKVKQLQKRIECVWICPRSAAARKENNE